VAHPRHGAVLVAQEGLGDEPRAWRPEQAQGEVGFAATQVLDRLILVGMADREGDPWRDLPQPQDQFGADEGGDELGRAEPELPPTGGRVEAGVRRKRFARQFDQRLDPRSQILRPLRRLEAVRPADEQRVLKEVAQSTKRMADGRLRQPQPLCRGAGAPGAQQFAEHQKQAAVEAT